MIDVKTNVKNQSNITMIRKKNTKNLYKIRSRTRYARLEDTAQNRVLLYKIRLIGERIRYSFVLNNRTAPRVQVQNSVSQRYILIRYQRVAVKLRSSIMTVFKVIMRPLTDIIAKGHPKTGHVIMRFLMKLLPQFGPWMGIKDLRIFWLVDFHFWDFFEKIYFHIFYF